MASRDLAFPALLHWFPYLFFDVPRCGCFVDSRGEWLYVEDVPF